MNRLEEYIERYTKLHNGEVGFKVEGVDKEIHGGSKFFDGNQFKKFLLKRLVRLKRLKHNLVFNILDYGCGKGNHVRDLNQSLYPRFQSITLYDPCVHFLSKKPTGKYNVITCADVMEHVPEEHVDEVLNDIYSYADTNAIFIFSISGKPAKKLFLDGENFHCTVKPVEWWAEKLQGYSFYSEMLYHNTDEQTTIHKFNPQLLDNI